MQEVKARRTRSRRKSTTGVDTSCSQRMNDMLFNLFIPVTSHTRPSPRFAIARRDFRPAASMLQPTRINKDQPSNPHTVQYLPLSCHKQHNVSHSLHRGRQIRHRLLRTYRCVPIRTSKVRSLHYRHYPAFVLPPEVATARRWLEPARQ